MSMATSISRSCGSSGRKGSEWAREVILRLQSYAEVSPSETGVKIWIRVSLALDRGRKVTLADTLTIGDKPPAIEVYAEKRYFTVGAEFKMVSAQWKDVRAS